MALFDQKKPQALFTLHGDMDNLTLIWGSIWAKIRQVATDIKSIRSRHVLTNVNQASEGSVGEKGDCFNSPNVFSSGSPIGIKSSNIE